jgi:hypothetical protein
VPAPSIAASNASAAWRRPVRFLRGVEASGDGPK